MKEAYLAILHMDRPVSRKHPPMPNSRRAAQFLPFSALSGYDDDVAEEGRWTERKQDPGESDMLELDESMRFLIDNLSLHPAVDMTLFVPDGKKAGGQYRHIHGVVKKIETYTRTLTMMDGNVIPMDDICSLLVGEETT